MSIKTNHTKDSLKPLSGVLTVDAKGAIALPAGSEVERPLGAAAGHIRFDQTSTKPEYFDGEVWDKLTSKRYVDTGDENLYDTIQSVIESYQDADLQEEQARIDGDATLQLNLDTETQSRIDGDATLDLRITTVESQVSGKVGSLIDLTTSEKTTIIGAINEVDANVDAEVTRATLAEQQLQTNIDNLSLDSLTDVRINLPTAGQVVSFDSAIGEFRNQTHQFNLLTKNFVGDSSTVEFALNETVATQNNLVVSVNGILQKPGYSYILANGDTLVFDEVPETGDLIEVRILKSTVTNDRPRPTVTGVSYGTVANYTTITITATDITFGTGAKIDDDVITRIDYPTPNLMQLMIETNKMTNPVWNNPRNLTLVDTSGNEFVFTNLINYGASKPHWTNSNSYIGTFSGGDTINFALALNNATSVTIDPAYAGESAIPWLSVSGNSIVGTAPQNSSPSRYEISVTATNGSVNITKNFWLMVL